MRKQKYSVLSKGVKRFSGKKILVIGDLLLDQYIWGEVSRISPEAPVPVVWMKGEDYMPGGACNVASNLARLGARVSLAGIVGDDVNSFILKEQLKERNISDEGIITEAGRPTVLKTRVIAHSQQVVRIDREHVREVTGRYFNMIVDYIRRNISEFDGIIIEDYGKGMITPQMLKIVVPLARKHRKIVAVDPKEDHFAYYKGVSVITPNNLEASKAVGIRIDSPKSLEKAGKTLIRKLNVDVMLITLGEEGMMVFEKGKDPCRIPTLAQEVYDVSGAGDTVIAAYTLSVVSGCSPVSAAYIANCAAGIVVGKVGVATVERDELLKRLRQEIGGKAA